MSESKINVLGILLIALTVIVTIQRCLPIEVILILSIAGCVCRFWGKP
jgi:hypothetical protein